MEDEYWSLRMWYWVGWEVTCPSLTDLRCSVVSDKPSLARKHDVVHDLCGTARVKVEYSICIGWKLRVLDPVKLDVARMIDFRLVHCSGRLAPVVECLN